MVLQKRPKKVYIMKLFRMLLCTASVALLLPLSSQAGDEFYGIIEKRPEGKVGSWMIGGKQVAATDKTKLEEEHGPLAVGACVEVEVEDEIVEEIESAKKEHCQK
jgi:hypothetical protein